MREFLGIDKALQSINGELRNNTAKLSELDKRIKQDTAKLKEIGNNPEGFSEEQKEFCKKRLQEERQARPGTLGSPPKDEGEFRKWLKKQLNRLANALKRLAGKAVAALPGIIGSVVGAILSFLDKTVGFLAQHTWALIIFAFGLIGAWLIRRVQS